MYDPRKLRHYEKERTRKANWFSDLSITNWIILINILFFLVIIVIFPPAVKTIMGKIVSVPNSFISDSLALSWSNIASGKIWTLLTSMFMHAQGFPVAIISFHLLINMFVLFSLGNLCEKIIGRKRFLWFYLISGIVAGLMFVLLAYLFGNTNPNSFGYRVFGSPIIAAVGASGAIFAIAGLFMILTPRLRFMIIFLPFFSLPAYIMIPLVLFLTWIVSSSVGIGIGNTAHFGGFLAGVFYGLYLRHKYKRKTKLIARYFSR